jgi:hypothetical protein
VVRNYVASELDFFNVKLRYSNDIDVFFLNYFWDLIN